MSESQRAEVGLYAHVAFCRRRCFYCDFNVFVGLDRLIGRYVDALVREASLLPPGVTVGSLFLGGGTPSMLSPEQVARLIDAASRAGLAADAEVTLEANPCDLTLGYLRGLRSAGVNRLSIGVQSFDDAILRRLGRRHDARQAIDACRLSREAGFDNVSLDLMLGLPGQELDLWRRTLATAVDLAPEHLSTYCLILEEGTPFEKWARQGKLVVPDDDATADMYEMARDALVAAGYEHYEISNWARREASRDLRGQHNLRYWLNQPYLGLGAGAHSCFGGRRWSNVRHPAEYARRVEAGESPEAESEGIPPDLEMAETVILGLRLVAGVDRASFRRRFGLDLADRYREPIADLVRLGLVDLTDAALRLTPRGLLLGNEAFQRFLPERR